MQNKYGSWVMPGHRRRRALFPGKALKCCGATSPCYTHLVHWAFKRKGKLVRAAHNATAVTFFQLPIFVAYPRDTVLPNHCTLYPRSMFLLFLNRLTLGFQSIILVLRSLPALYPIIMLQQQLQKYSLDTTDNKG